jgi:hypothetical protein
MDARFASNCLVRAHAADISQVYVESKNLEATIKRVTEKSNIPLSILHFHFDYKESYQQLFRQLERTTMLVELCISNSTIMQPLRFQLPLLTRLHLIDVRTDLNCEHIVVLLQYSPLLTELVFQSDRRRDHRTIKGPIKPTQQHNLSLPHLRILVLEPGDYYIMRSFLGALSLENQSLQDVSLKARGLTILHPSSEKSMRDGKPSSVVPSLQHICSAISIMLSPTYVFYCTPRAM